jgi:general secretion pathway protein D
MHDPNLLHLRSVLHHAGLRLGTPEHACRGVFACLLLAVASQSLAQPAMPDTAPATPPAAAPSGPAGGASPPAPRPAAAPALALPTPPGPGRPGRQEPITLNFMNADIEAVTRTMATLLGRSIVVDPRVRGTINLATDRPVPPQAAYAQFLATLRLAGYTVVDSAGLLKVVPEADAKLQGGPVVVERTAGGQAMATQIFRLQHESAANLVPVLRPLISPNNTLNVAPGTNSLVITDYADNLQRLGRIIAALDLPAFTDLEVVPLRHTVAADLAPVVQRLAEAGGGGPTVGPAAAGLDASGRVVVVPEARSNALILRAPNPARLNLARSLVERLDQPGPQSPGGNLHVVYLKNAEATRLAVTLRAALASLAPPAAGSAGGGTPAGGAGALQAGGPASLVAPAGGGAGSGTATSAPIQPTGAPTTGGQIQADPATNALIITAPDPLYRQLRAVIDQLDTRRAQVFVESLIAEVNADKAAELGIQWQHVLGNTGNRTIGVIGTNFTTGGANLFALNASAAQATPSTVPSPGGNLGIVRHINGTFVLAGLARFLETQADGNVLSTPNLLTLDNEEARIVIGQNVPFVTGQYTNNNAGGGATVNPFQTIERRDVGLTLRVRPQISENGTVKMQIFQEVSSVQAGSISAPTGPVTNKRSIESNVLVDDGAIIVLGGLLQDEYAGNGQKVPGLGDIPGLGWLFKSESRNRRKTNLMVFLRPVVVRDAPQGDALTLDRYDLMRLQQRQVQPTPSTLMTIPQAPQMPPLPPPAPRPGVGAAPLPAPAPAVAGPRVGPPPPSRDRE